MPTRLTRYILWEIIKVFTVALVALTLLIMVVGIGRQLLREGLGPAAVVQLLPYVLPISLQFAIPATSLFAVCLVYGRMSADGEVSTVKAAGISPLRILSPGIWFGVLLSPLAVWLGDVAVSWGQPGLDRVVFESVEDIVYRMLRAQHSYSTPKGLSIHVQDVQDRRLLFPVITLHLGEEAEPVTFTAKEGRLELDTERRMLKLHLVDSQIWGVFQGRSIGEDVISIPLDKAMRKGSIGDARPSELALQAIPQETQLQRIALEQSRQSLATEAGIAMATGRWDELAGSRGSELYTEIVAGVDRMARLRTEPWRRWAGGFSCLAFMLVAAPLAIIVRSADPWTAFGMCFLPILLAYYPLFLFGLEQAKVGAMPPYVVWLGNVALGMISLPFIRRVWRY